MKLINLLLIVLGLLCYTNAMGQCESSDTTSPIVFNVIVQKPAGNQLTLVVTVENRSSDTIYVTTDPLDLFGHPGPYVVGNSENGELALSSRLYEKPIPTPYANKTAVKLTKLLPGEKYNWALDLHFPLRETQPPRGTLRGNEIIEGKTLQLESLTSLLFSVGYFMRDETIEKLYKGLPNKFITGDEVLDAGKPRSRIATLQRIANCHVAKALLN